MFKSVHLALPVRNLERATAFFELFFGAKIIILEAARRRCTVAYDRFEFSLFEDAEFTPYQRGELGPFHIGHETMERGDVDRIWALAKMHYVDVLCPPFDRDDGDYALFLRDEQGIIFEFFHGGHALARSASEARRHDA
jgi:catechol 2,3-dioxygenase-like lactoylglutathione lyase family enzyme